MREFFHSWRRQVGCIALVIALVAMTGWIRSLTQFDLCNCPFGPNYAVAMTSWKSAIAIRAGWALDDPWTEYVWDTRDYDNWGYEDSPESSNYRFTQPIPDGSGCFVTWYLLGKEGGIGLSPLDQRPYCYMVFAIVPYWSVTFPLTLLSAYLILWNPRKKPGPDK